MRLNSQFDHTISSCWKEGSEDCRMSLHGASQFVDSHLLDVEVVDACKKVCMLAREDQGVSFA
jgi:hypothetical protein